MSNLPANESHQTTRLDNSTRRVPKATLVSFQMDPVSNGGAALLKFGFLRQLGLQSGEVEAVQSELTASRQGPQDLEMLRAFEATPIPSQLPAPSVLAPVPAEQIKAFATSILRRRKLMLDDARARVADASAEVRADVAVAKALNLVNATEVAIKWLDANLKITPIGMLNLERIDMTPVGIERGGLVATIPLAPMEKTAVVHKEWSVTSREFTSIVTDSLENYSETGVTENSELAQSTQSQTEHSNRFNITASVSGGYGPVTATVTTGFETQDHSSASANESRKHAINTTRKASTRVKQEHKVTIQTTTVTGTEETSTRTLENPSRTDPIRIDYFSMMRKWHVGLYRYGLRLTYDIAIPEPAAAMRKAYARLDELTKLIGPFSFDIGFSNITRENWPDLAAEYQTVLKPPPEDTPQRSYTTSYTVSGDTSRFGPVHTMTIEIPDGYRVTTATLYTDQESDVHISDLLVMRVPHADIYPDPTKPMTGPLHYLEGLDGKQFLTYSPKGSPSGVLEVDLKLKLKDEAFTAWQEEAWTTLYNAAQTQYYTQQQEYQNEIAELQEKLTNVDTLTLRREENEEIMKGVLRWLLGPTFDFMPEDVYDLFVEQLHMDLEHGTTYDDYSGDALYVTTAGWYPMFIYQEMVKFIHQAIEWENILYFPYSYFWDVQPSWNFIRQLRHPDATRQAFLRAGSARVVLTVRRGWEDAWLNFVEAGGFGEMLPPDHPYISIAKEIAAYDSTNYPGIPPANPGGGPLPESGNTVATVSRQKVGPSASQVTLAVTSSEGFLVGYSAVIDAYTTGSTTEGAFVTAQESQTIVAIPDRTHITVERLVNAHDGTRAPFPVRQAGETGQLIAEWFEYTPTSGTDIEVTSDLDTIA